MPRDTEDRMPIRTGRPASGGRKADATSNSILDLPAGAPKSDPETPTPFPYDARVLGRLRPDQVPRFLGAITHPPKETRVLPLSSLVAIQNRIDPKKVAAMRKEHVDELPTVVRFNDTNYIVDGHHRLTVAFLNGEKQVRVRYKDISDYSASLKAQAPIDGNKNCLEGIPTEDSTWPPSQKTVDEQVKRLKADGMYGAGVTWRSDVSAAIAALALAVEKAARRRSPPKGYPKDKRDYAVPDKYLFPIDRKHIHAAISYFPHHHWTAGDNKRQAAQRILHAARRFGVQIDPDDAVSQAAR